MQRPLKDCFGTVISNLKKLKECVRCELLQECRAINWNAAQAEEPVVVRRVPGDGPAGGGVAAPAGGGQFRPGGASGTPASS